MNDKGVRISFMQLLNDHIDDLKNKTEYQTAKDILKIGKDSQYVIKRQMFEYSNDKRKDTKEENALISETKKIGKNILKTDKKGYSNYEKLYNNLNKHPAFKAFFEQTGLKKADMFGFGEHIAEFKTKSMEQHEKQTAKQKVAKQQTQKEIETLKGENKEKTKKIESLKKSASKAKRDRSKLYIENLNLKDEIEKNKKEIENIRKQAEQDKANAKAHYKEKYIEKEEKLIKLKKDLKDKQKEINTQYDTIYANALAEHKKKQQEEILRAEKERLDEKYKKIYEDKVNTLKRDKETKMNENITNLEYDYRHKDAALYTFYINRGSGGVVIGDKDREKLKKYFNVVYLDSDKAGEMLRALGAQHTKDLEIEREKAKITESDLNNILTNLEKEKQTALAQIQKEIEEGKRKTVFGEVDFINFTTQLNEEKQKALEEAKETIKQKETEFKEWKKQNAEEQKQALNEIDAKYSEQINNLNAKIEEERKQAEEDKRTIKADANRDKNEKIAQMKHKMEERHEKEKEELLEEAQQNQKEIYGFAPNLEAYIKKKLAAKAYSLDEDELIDKIARDIGKPGGLPKGTDPKLVAKAIYDRGAEETLKHIKKIANLALLTGYNNDLYNKLPGDVAQEVQKYITDKINDDIRKKNIKYILPKDKPRWEYAMQTKNLNPMLGRSAWRVN